MHQLNTHEFDVLINSVAGPTSIHSFLCGSEFLRVSASDCLNRVDFVTATTENVLYLHTLDNDKNVRTSHDVNAIMSAFMTGQMGYVVVGFEYCTKCERGGIYLVSLHPITVGIHELVIRIEGS